MRTPPKIKNKKGKTITILLVSIILEYLAIAERQEKQMRYKWWKKDTRRALFEHERYGLENLS